MCRCSGSLSSQGVLCILVLVDQYQYAAVMMVFPPEGMLPGLPGMIVGNAACVGAGGVAFEHRHYDLK